MTVPFPFADHGARPAIAWQDRHLTGADLEALVRRAMGALAAYNLKPGDVVALYGPNSLEWVVAALAAWRLGATVALVSARWTPMEAALALEDLAPQVILHGAQDVDLQAAPLLALDDLLAAETTPLEPSLASSPDAHATAALLFTSGTTGRPKAVELTWGALHTHALAVAHTLGMEAADRWWLAMPMSHVGGLGVLLRCGWRGAQVVLETRFDPAAFVSRARRGEVTLASFVPTMLQAVLDQLDGEPWPDGLRACMLGGAPVPPALVARCPAAIATYGLTEAGSTVTLVPPGADTETRATCGYPLPGTELRILDDTGRPLPAGEVGGISVRGPGVMAGYRGNPAATARALDGEGWLRTGDYGVLDAQGRLQLCARREDLIISGGENVYPAEVEFVLSDHPAVAAASVVGKPHPRWGEAPVAFLVARGDPPSTEALHQYLEARLARYKRPRAVAWLDVLPLLPNGKVDRHTLKARAAAVEFALEW